MDELLKEMERFKEVTSAFTFADVGIVLVLSFLLSMIIGSVYRATHRGTSYSQSFAQTLVLMSVTTALIMLIIGSNIARAFSLVGALSIIRFRNAVKETRDVGYMFVAMAIGMAAGTRFYVLATIATAFLSAMLVFMFKIDLFQRRVAERILRVRHPAGIDISEKLEPIFASLLADHRLISLETVAGGVLEERVYSVVLKDEAQSAALLGKVREVNGNNKVAVVIGQHEVDL